MAGPFGSTLGLGTAGAARGAQNQQILEQQRFKLAEMRRAEEQAQRDELATQQVLANLYGRGAPDEGELFTKGVYPIRDDADIPAVPTAGLAVPTAPTKPTGAQIATQFVKEFYNPENKADVEKYKQALEKSAVMTGTPIVPTAPTAPTAPAKPRTETEIRRAITDSAVKSLGKFFVAPPNLPTAPAKPTAPTKPAAPTTPKNKVEVEKFAQQVANFVQTIVKPPGVSTPEQDNTPTAQVLASPTDASNPPSGSSFATYLNNPGIIPAELTRANRARDEMIQMANIFRESLATGSEKYLAPYIELKAKIDQVDTQMFLLGASQGLLNLSLGDTQLLSDVLSAARGTQFQIVDRKDNDNFDVYVGNQLYGVNVSFDQIAEFAEPLVSDAYQKAWQASQIERDKMVAESQIKLANDMTLAAFKGKLEKDVALAKADADLIIEGIKAEVEIEKLNRTKADFNVVNGSDDNVYFYAKDGSAVYRAETKNIGIGKNKKTITRLVPVEFPTPLVISGQ